MFLRFVVSADDEYHKLLTGIVAESRLFRDRGFLTDYVCENLENIYEWFNTNLPCPPFQSAGWPRDAVSWFKDSAKEPIKKIRELSVLFEAHGFGVRTLYSDRPGKVLYEDKYQILVIERDR